MANRVADKVRSLRGLRIPAGLGPVLVLIMLSLVIASINPRFLSPINISNIARQSSILLIIALGETIIILMGCIDLSIEGLMAISGVLVSFLVLNQGASSGWQGVLPPNLNWGIWGVLIAVGVATLMGFLNGLIYTKLRIPSFMVTLGMWSIGTGLATWLYGGYPLRILDPTLVSWAKESTGPIPNLAFFAVVMFVVALFLEKFTRMGRYVFAIGGGEDRAKLAGIPVDKYKIIAFTIAGCFYGIAGILNAARIGAGTSRVGEGTLFAAITAVVVGGTALTGGVGGVFQTLIGVLIVTVINNGMIITGVHHYIQLAVQGVIITTAVALTLDRTKIPIVK
jgi:ribose transport system permease protein